ncbi:MAG: MBL fold metallo-hydrolase [Ruminococcus sp.]|nr:MBL fold metallo-hydrolase [Ruminococcus sp.]
MNLIKLILGELATNCYILETGNGEAIAFDIGDGAKKVIQALETYHLQLKAILLTHGHYDHVAGVEEVRRETGADVYIHEKDAVMLESGQANLSWQLTSETYQPVTEYHTLKDGDILEFGSLKIQVMHTPGHTPGGVCYLTEDMMFSGDTLFKGSVGRIDLGGNREQMMISLRKIASLEKNYQVYPGHFDASTLDAEKKSNPYLRAFT